MNKFEIIKTYINHKYFLRIGNSTAIGALSLMGRAPIQKQ